MTVPISMGGADGETIGGDVDDRVGWEWLSGRVRRKRASIECMDSKGSVDTVRTDYTASWA